MLPSAIPRFLRFIEAPKGAFFTPYISPLWVFNGYLRATNINSYCSQYFSGVSIVA